jgi:branched-chain amino acid transport system substrate-binding protein
MGVLRWVSAAGLVSVVLAAAACSSTTTSKTTNTNSTSKTTTTTSNAAPLKVGMVYEKTGIYSVYAEQYQQGFDIGLDYATGGTGKGRRSPGGRDLG